MDFMCWIESAANRDRQVSEEIAKRLNNKYLVGGITFFTELGSSLAAFLILAVMAVLSGPAVIFLLVPIYIIQLGIVELIKFVAKKPRPRKRFKGLKEVNLFGMRAVSGSFPSGHASNIFTMAILISTFYSTSPLVTGLLYLIAILVSISRIYLGKHYLVDVVVGALIGIVVTSILVTV